MPTAVDKLGKDSSDEATTKAISSCIATEIKSGRKRDQAVKMCYEMARRKTGKSLGAP